MISWNVQKNITLVFCWLEMILLMEEILHQLRLVVYPIIFCVLYIRWLFGISEPSAVRFSPSFFLLKTVGGHGMPYISRVNLETLSQGPDKMSKRYISSPEKN